MRSKYLHKIRQATRMRTVQRRMILAKINEIYKPGQVVPLRVLQPTAFYYAYYVLLRRRSSTKLGYGKQWI